MQYGGIKDGDIIFRDGIEYKVEIKTVSFGDNGKTIIIQNNTPILTPKERERRKKEIDKRLYDVFSKYQKKKD